MKTFNMASAVIGAGYGDEAKGVTTDVLAGGMTAADTLVVRTNGSNQAGHTVTTAAGRSHIFHHLSSGALAGAATHWSAMAVANPMFLIDEIEAVRRLGGNVNISCDPRTLITTPFDAIINQAAEIARGVDRHGSCGMGFGETIERNLRPQFGLQFQALLRPDLRQRLVDIRDTWVPERLAKLGIVDGKLDRGLAEVLATDAVIDRYLEDCAAFVGAVAFLQDRRIADGRQVIFEGAQGLGLDMDQGVMPFCTRSNTGLKNQLTVAKEAGITLINAVYVTRAYVTRHGAGPLAHERPKLPYFEVVDLTNHPNPWQGTIRYGDLDLDVLKAAIDYDLALAEGTGIRINASLAVTCLDQAAGAFDVYQDGAPRTLHAVSAAAKIAEAVGLPLFGEGWGPTRNDFYRAPCLRTLAA